ncbi:hypothetical protein ON010_g7877 [Phytophthora cinnamomi]|nr:hypothetical protein ON010_g7877 [Phytophthora cinnamomi]
MVPMGVMVSANATTKGLPKRKEWHQYQLAIFFATYCWKFGWSTSYSGKATSTVLSKISHISWYHKRFVGYKVELYPSHQLAITVMRSEDPPPNPKVPVTTQFLRQLHRSLNFPSTQHRVIGVGGGLRCWASSSFAEIRVLSRQRESQVLRHSKSDVRFLENRGREQDTLGQVDKVELHFRGSKNGSVWNGKRHDGQHNEGATSTPNPGCGSAAMQFQSCTSNLAPVPADNLQDLMMTPDWLRKYRSEDFTDLPDAQCARKRRSTSAICASDLKVLQKLAEYKDWHDNNTTKCLTVQKVALREGVQLPSGTLPSRGWIYRFQQRSSLWFSLRHGEGGPLDHEVVEGAARRTDTRQEGEGQEPEQALHFSVCSYQRGRHRSASIAVHWEVEGTASVEIPGSCGDPQAPPNTTAALQPMDQGIIKGLKDQYHDKKEDAVLDRFYIGIVYTPVDIFSVVKWLSEGWGDLSTKATQRPRAGRLIHRVFKYFTAYYSVFYVSGWLRNSLPKNEVVFKSDADRIRTCVLILSYASPAFSFSSWLDRSSGGSANANVLELSSKQHPSPTKAALYSSLFFSPSKKSPNLAVGYLETASPFTRTRRTKTGFKGVVAGIARAPIVVVVNVVTRS